MKNKNSTLSEQF